MDQEASRRRRRSYSAEFKAEAVAACRKPGASTAAATLERSINANVLRRWVVEAERAERLSVTPRSLPPPAGASAKGSFVALPMLPKAVDTTPITVAAWIAVEPMDMRAGVDTALARVVNVFGEARAHHAYLFVNKRANRMKVLVHDGFAASDPEPGSFTLTFDAGPEGDRALRQAPSGPGEPRSRQIEPVAHYSANSGKQLLLFSALPKRRPKLKVTSGPSLWFNRRVFASRLRSRVEGCKSSIL
jgi:hypothetical protein